MGQSLRIENKDWSSFVTTRTCQSRLWFLNNPKLTERILAYLAKYQTIYRVKIYQFTIMGNHYHLVAKFPYRNRARFMRDLNAIIARLVGRYVPEFEGGRVWSRRYSEQPLVKVEDLEHWLYYAALNPVSSGLAASPKDYQGYNSFWDAIGGVRRKFKIINRADFNSARRYNSKIKLSDYTEQYELAYDRLPGYESMSNVEYRCVMLDKLEVIRTEILERMRAAGKGFPGPGKLAQTKVGALPRKTKRSERNSKRPLILTLCQRTRRKFLDFYFSIRAAFTEARERLRRGEPARFPQGTYHPPGILLVE